MPKKPGAQISPHEKLRKKLRASAADVSPSGPQSPPQRNGDRGSDESDAAASRKFLSAAAVCARYGDISTMSLWRWLADEELRFPRPTMTVQSRRYWALDVLLEWEKSRIVPRATEAA
jgi:predicted DNA-binding transcriptional regulator AlpA